MFTKSQQQTLSRKFATAITKALDAFPDILAQAEPDAAAAVIAGIIKTQLTVPVPPPDPQEALDEVLRRIEQTEHEGS